MRITKDMIERKIELINKVMGANPETWTRTIDGLKANIGNYHMYECHRHFALHKVANTGGGIISILSVTTKRELYVQVSAYLQGLEDKHWSKS